MTYAVRSLMFHVDELSSRLSPTMVYTSSLIGRKRNSSWSSTWRCRPVRNARLPHRKYFHRNNPSLVGPALLTFLYLRCCDQYLSVSSLDQRSRYGVLTCARPCNALTITLQVALVAWAFVRQFSSSSWWISPSDMRLTRLFY